MAKNKIKVESKDLEGEQVIVYVTRPTRDDNMKAQAIASKTFKEAMQNGAFVKKTLENMLLKQGIWDNEKQAEVDKIDEEIKDNLVKLKKGGIKLSEARKIAIDIRLARIKRTSISAERNSYDEYTAESQANDAKFDYLVSVCVKNAKGKPYFKDVDDYRDKIEEPYAYEAASKLAGMLYGLDENWEETLPENKFLKKFNFVDDELRLVNEDGKYVTTDGKMIDNDFRYIDKDGNFIDVDGNKVDEDGLPIVEEQPFLDDKGNPIVEDVIVDPKEKDK